MISLLAQRKLEDRLVFRGLQISIENKAGSVRSGVSKDGHPWSVQMSHPYGYVRNSMGVDGDHVDCFIGPDTDAKNVYVIHSKVPETGKYDEDKCMLGFSSASAAKQAFLKNFTSPDFYGSMDTIPFETFKKKVLSTKSKPAMIKAGGPGSGCKGPNCGRKAGLVSDLNEKHDFIHDHSFRLASTPDQFERLYNFQSSQLSSLLSKAKAAAKSLGISDEAAIKKNFELTESRMAQADDHAAKGDHNYATRMQDNALNYLHMFIKHIHERDDIKASSQIGTPVTVDGLPGRGIITAVYKGRANIKFRNGLVVSRDFKFIHPLSENTHNKMWRDDNTHELESAKEWDELREGLPTDPRPVNGARIEKQGTQFCVKRDGVDKNFGCFPSQEEAEERASMKVKNLVVASKKKKIKAGGEGSGCKGPNCGRPREADRTDARQTSLHGPKHGEELREWYAKRQRQVDAFESALNKASGRMMSEYRNKITHRNTYAREIDVFHTHLKVAKNFLLQGGKLLKSDAAQDHLDAAKAALDKAVHVASNEIKTASGELNWAFHQMRLAVQAGPIAERHRKYFSRDSRQLDLFSDGDGEPMTGNMSHSHIDPQVWFQPPSLKNKKPVPTDDPGETDDEFLDVTKRKSKDTQEFRMKQLNKQGPNSPIPVKTTLVQHQTAGTSEVLGAGIKLRQRPARVGGGVAMPHRGARTSVSYDRRGCV